MNDLLGNPLLLEPKDLIGLPDELVRELSFGKTEKRYAEILSALDKLGGEACLDKLLIVLFKDSGKVYKRTDLVPLMYRMGRKGLVIAVRGKKGIYRVPNG